MTLSSGTHRIMAVGFRPGPPRPFGRPTELLVFDPSDLSMACIAIRCCDAADYRQRFYAVKWRRT